MQSNNGEGCNWEAKMERKKNLISSNKDKSTFSCFFMLSNEMILQPLYIIFLESVKIMRSSIRALLLFYSFCERLRGKSSKNGKNYSFARRIYPHSFLWMKHLEVNPRLLFIRCKGFVSAGVKSSLLKQTLWFSRNRSIKNMKQKYLLLFIQKNWFFQNTICWCVKG